MLNDNAKKWLAALRSGEYKQGKGYLCRNGKFCCLGVGSDLYAKEHPEYAVRDVRHSVPEGFSTVRMYADTCAVCSPPVAQWLGLRTVLGSYSESSLAAKNDTGCPFSEIADLIESEPEGLFV